MKRRDTCRIGTTLSQVALAIRLKRTSASIRADGNYIYDFGRPRTECWERMEFRNGRCAGYRRVL